MRAPVKVYHSSSSGFDDSARILVRDSAAWRGVWARLAQRSYTPPPPPAADFAHEMVVLAALGERTYSRDAITIDSVSRSDGRVRVFVTKERLGPTCDAGAAMTQPVDAVRVRRDDSDADFVERERVVADCGAGEKPR